MNVADENAAKAQSRGQRTQGRPWHDDMAGNVPHARYGHLTVGLRNDYGPETCDLPIFGG